MAMKTRTGMRVARMAGRYAKTGTKKMRKLYRRTRRQRKKRE